MKSVEIRDCLVGALLALLLPAGLMAQEREEKKPEPPRAEARKASSKPALAKATRVSTDEAVRNAAQKKAGTSALEDASRESNGSAVTELHPVAPTSENSDAANTESPKTSKKSPSRNIHGSVYGASGSGGDSTRRSGGSVGASSKSGKTSIYVESNRSSESQPTSK